MKDPNKVHDKPSSSLKHCPFCGGEAAFKVSTYSVSVECTVCFSATRQYPSGSFVILSKQDARDLWNQRFHKKRNNLIEILL